MANPLFNQMQGNTFNPLLQRVQQIKQQMGGDPNQHIQNLLNSGKVSQAQYDQAVQKVEQLKRMMGR